MSWSLAHRPQRRQPRGRPDAWRLLPLLALALLLAWGCGEEDDGPDAYGNFEATEVRVSAEVGGRLEELAAVEGAVLEAGAVVARVEVTELVLERAEVEARQRATASRNASVDAQVAVLEEQLRLAETELARTRRLAADQAATPQQLDRAESEVAVLERRIREAASQRGVIADEVTALEARQAQVEDRIGRGEVVNPVRGTVLTVFAEAGELVAPGQPLYDIADLSTLVLRAYVSGGQLPELSLGQAVEVAVDGGKDEGGGGSLRRLPGTISRIASEAEFTPSTLETREDRVDLVYAVEVRVPNPDGLLKIGMPGELSWARPEG